MMERFLFQETMNRVMAPRAPTIHIPTTPTSQVDTYQSVIGLSKAEYFTARIWLNGQ